MQPSLHSRPSPLCLRATICGLLCFLISLVGAGAEVVTVTGAVMAAEHQPAQAGLGGESFPQTELVPILVLSVVAITMFRRRVRQ